MDREIWFVLIDPVPRYPVIDNEIDERAADPPRSAPIRPDPPRSDASWQGNRDGSRAVKSTGPTLERQLTA